MTIINSTLSQYADTLNEFPNSGVVFTHRRKIDPISPPGVLVVTRQAEEIGQADITSGWASLQTTFQKKILSHTRTVAGTNILASIPLAIIVSNSANAGNDWWPNIWLKFSDSAPVEPAYLISAILNSEVFTEKLNNNNYSNDWKLGPAATFDQLGATVLGQPQNFLAWISALCLSYGLLQRSRQDDGQPLPREWLRNAIVTARNLVLKQLKQLKKLSLNYLKDGKSITVPENSNALPDATIEIQLGDKKHNFQQQREWI